MFSYFRKNKSQKELYFQLNSCMTIERTEKAIKGIYAIYKSDICLYVGQSSNIASRLATHLSGRYKDIDKIFIFEQTDDEDLILNEKYCIQKLKPTENLLVDYDEKICINELFSYFYDIEKEEYANILDYYEFCLIVDNYNIFIFDADIAPDLYSSNKLIKELMIKPLMEGQKNEH